jgi:hypothetical protein
MTERAGWTITYEGDKFERFLLSLPEYEQAVLVAAIEYVLKVYGVNICEGEWGRPLGDGLYEFRVKKSLGALLDTAGVDVLRRPGDDKKCFCASSARFMGTRLCCFTMAMTKSGIHQRSVSSERSIKLANCTKHGKRGRTAVDTLCAKPHNYIWAKTHSYICAETHNYMCARPHNYMLMEGASHGEGLR